MEYAAIPSLDRWLKDSSVAFAIRKNDIVLDRIDRLLENYWLTKDISKRFIFQSDLFFTADFWLKSYKTNRRMETGREPAMLALFARLAHDLCIVYGCTINGLPRELELMWGRGLSAGGVYVDVNARCAEYISRADATKYRLWFRGGKAHMLPWFNPSQPSAKLQLADSYHAYVPEAQVGGQVRPSVNYGFFVLSMSRDLYMAKHRTTDGNGPNGFYHSSYVAGEPVQCSGSMLIERGVIKRVRLNSGHYQPQASQCRALIMALRMWGVPLDKVVFEDFTGLPIGKSGSVQDVLDTTSDALQLLAFREKTVKANEAAFNKMPKPDMSQSPNPRDWWGNRPRQPDAKPPAIVRY